MRVILRTQLVQMMNKTANKGRKQSVTAGNPPNDLWQWLCNSVILDGDDEQDLPISNLRSLRGNAAADIAGAVSVSAGVEDLRIEQSGLHNADCLHCACVDLSIFRE